MEELKKQVRKQSDELANEIAVTAAKKLEDLNTDLNFPHSHETAPNNHHQQIQSDRVKIESDSLSFIKSIQKYCFNCDLLKSLQTIGIGGYCFFEQLRSAGQFGLITLPFTVFTLY